MPENDFACMSVSMFYVGRQAEKMYGYKDEKKIFDCWALPTHLGSVPPHLRGVYDCKVLPAPLPRDYNPYPRILQILFEYASEFKGTISLNIVFVCKDFFTFNISVISKPYSITVLWYEAGDKEKKIGGKEKKIWGEKSQKTVPFNSILTHFRLRSTKQVETVE